MTTSSVYGPLGLSLFSGEVNYLDDTIKAMLLNSTYVPDQDNHSTVSDVTAFEISASGYIAGGVTLANTTITYDAATNKVKLSCDNLSWINTTWSDVRYLVFYDNTNASKPLLCYVDFETPQSTTSAPFTYLIPSDGFLNVTVI